MLYDFKYVTFGKGKTMKTVKSGYQGFGEGSSEQVEHREFLGQ